MTKIEFVNPAEMGPSQGLYSQIVIHKEAHVAYISGQVSIDENGDFVGEGDYEKQTEQILNNIGKALDYLGEGWASVLKLTTFLTSEEGLPGFGAARRRLFDTEFPTGAFPAHTLMIVAGLSQPHHLVELEAVVAYSGNQ